MKLIFMRHGEATDNVKGLISDKEIYWSVLTENGKKVVSETILELPIKIDKIYVSPFPRTLQTANIVYNKYSSSDVIVDNRIREIFHGKYSGQYNNEDLDNTRQKQIAGDYLVRFGDYGENKLEIEIRLTSFLKDVYSMNDENSTILIVSHGSVISYMKRILGLKHSHASKGKAEVFDDVVFTGLDKYMDMLESIKNEAKNEE